MQPHVGSLKSAYCYKARSYWNCWICRRLLSQSLFLFCHSLLTRDGACLIRPFEESAQKMNENVDSKSMPDARNDIPGKQKEMSTWGMGPVPLCQTLEIARYECDGKKSKEVECPPAAHHLRRTLAIHAASCRRFQTIPMILVYIPILYNPYLTPIKP